MTHVMVLSAKVRRNERLWQTLDIGNVFGPTLASRFHRNFNLRNNTTKKIAFFLIWKINCSALHYSKFGSKSLKWSIMGTSTLDIDFMHIVECTWRNVLSMFSSKIFSQWSISPLLNCFYFWLLIQAYSLDSIFITECPWRNVLSLFSFRDLLDLLLDVGHLPK